MINFAYFITRLAHNAEPICALVQGITEEQARWKPSPAEWSILEVINHLYDEEREDFRARLDLLLNHPGQPWPANDPEGWVVERQYNRRDPETSAQNFLVERQRSLAWLKTLSAPDWDVFYTFPSGYKLSAGDLLASWLAHDCLHLRQLAELHWKYTAFLAQPYRVDYAGPW